MHKRVRWRVWEIESYSLGVKACRGINEDCGSFSSPQQDAAQF